MSHERYPVRLFVTVTNTHHSCQNTVQLETSGFVIMALKITVRAKLARVVKHQSAFAQATAFLRPSLVVHTTRV